MSNVPVNLVGDVERISQVLNNLLANSIQYGLPDTIVEIFSSYDEEHKKLKISV